MVSIHVQLANVPGTEAAMGWAGSHTIVVDRPEGVAGGLGLGFNGGQLLALAIGGCFCNDLRYVAAELDAQIAEISVAVSLHLEGDPLIATAADMQVTLTTKDGSDPHAIVDRARTISTVSNSLAQGVPVSVRLSS